MPPKAKAKQAAKAKAKAKAEAGPKAKAKAQPKEKLKKEYVDPFGCSMLHYACWAQVHQAQLQPAQASGSSSSSSRSRSAEGPRRGRRGPSEAPPARSSSSSPPRPSLELARDSGSYLLPSYISTRHSRPLSRETAVAMLLEKRSNVNRCDRAGATPLHWLCSTQDQLDSWPKVLRLLLDAKANPLSKDRAGKTPLMELCFNELVRPEMLQCYAQEAGTVNERGKYGDYALHVLCLNHNFPPLWPLLNARAEVNAVARMGLTPLHALCSTIGLHSCVSGTDNLKSLLEAKADVDATNDEDVTAFDCLVRSYWSSREWQYYNPESNYCLMPAALAGVSRHLLMAAAEKHKDDLAVEKAIWLRRNLWIVRSAIEPEVPFEMRVPRRGVLQGFCDNLDQMYPSMTHADIEFEGEYAAGRGVLREVLSTAWQELAEHTFGLVTVTPTDPPRLYFPTSIPWGSPDLLQQYEMIGMLMGLAFQTEQHLPLPFARPLIKRMFGIPLEVEDLKEIDPDLYQQLSNISKMSEEDLQTLDLNFSIHEELDGKRRKIDLVFGGDKMTVTKGNCDLYINLYASKKLEVSEEAFQAFHHGLQRFCPLPFIVAAKTLFTIPEFELFMGGPDEIDVEDWKKHTKYQGDIQPTRNSVIKWFWEVVFKMSQSELRSLLRFATGRVAAPVGGFRYLSSIDEPIPFTIALTDKPNKKLVRTFFPRAATCTHLLTLPRYEKAEDLEKYLLSACRSEMMQFSETAS